MLLIPVPLNAFTGRNKRFHMYEKTLSGREGFVILR